MAPAASTPDAAKRPGNQGAKNRSPTRAGTPSSPASNNVARTKSTRTTAGSPMTAKGAARKPGAAAQNESNLASEELKASNAALIDDLKERLRKAEAASEEYQKQAYVLQTKLDDATNDHAKIEEASQDQLDKLEVLQKEKQDAFRRNRELQSVLDADKAVAEREKAEAAAREEGLNEIVQRLKESLNHRENRKSADGESVLSGTTNFRGRSSPRPGTESPSSQSRDDSQNNSKLVMQKDKVIEALRLELAEAQIRLVEVENSGGGRMQELEKKLLESRMSNAKLMEDNESYQVLLSEKTLNGDFSKSNIFDSANSTESSRTPTREPGSSSLADELDTADDTTADSPSVRNFESELSAAKDQNKALTLYINKIITRLLQNEQFETLFGDGSLTSEGPPKVAAKAKAKVDEPVDLRDVPITEDGVKTPPRSNLSTSHSSPPKENLAPSLLQRAGSIFGGRQRGRPKSLNPAIANASVEVSQPNPAQGALPPTPSTANNFLSAPNQDPSTAPSLPLRRTHSGRGGNRSTTMRTHRRATSEWSPTTSTGMYRGPPSDVISPHTTAGMLSPRGGAASTTLQSAPPPLILEDTETHEPESMKPHPADVTSDSGYGESVAGSTDPPGSPRSAAAAALEGKQSQPQRSDTQDSKAAAMAAGAANWFTGATKTSAQMRPLRLVQEKVEADEAAKKANRSSFMGWFNKPGQGQAGASILGSSPPSSSMLGSPPPMLRKASHESRPSTGGIQEEP